jgi:hypothetical protein
MSRTFLRQDTQIRNSDVYNDAVPPTLAAYQTNPTEIETDLNNLRSQLQNYLNRNGAVFPTGKWYDDLIAPSTFENGLARGLNATNQQLHDLERKRVLVEVFNPVDIPVGIQATGVLTATGVFANNETVSIGGQTYTLKSPFVNAANNIDATSSTAQTLENLRRAINNDGVSGANYGTGTLVNANVTAVDTVTTLTLQSKTGGTAGNSVVTTETCANASFGAATLTGGVLSNTSILNRSNMLPSNTILAIGVGITLGTVVAAHGGAFGTSSLTIVAGATVISPKNLIAVTDAATHDPILSSGRRIYALMQSESTVNGSTATLVTPNRLQLTYVRLNASSTALEAVPAADLAGMLVRYTAVERKALEDFNEQDFLRGTSLDVPSSSTVTRQAAYDNQGATAVELSTAATLDLNAAGLTWKLRDLINADLFRVVEGSGTSNTRVAIDTDVDFFDVNAVDNDFLNGVKIDTGSAGTTINVGVTANQIDAGGPLRITSGSATDLSLAGALKLNLADSFRAGSTWSLTDGLSISNTSAEWSLFETNFGEVSLLNAINQAYVAAGPIITKTFAVVTANVNANIDVGGVAGGANLDAALPSLAAGVFLRDFDVYLNGQLLRPGVNAAADHDYYPGTSLATGQLKFEFKLKINDVLCVIARA